METLKLSKQNAIKLFPKADKWFKQMCIDTFGADCFSGNIMDRITEFEDACEDQRLDPQEELPFKNPTTPRQEATNAFHKLDIISTSLLEGTILDWTNPDQKKWYPYFYDYTSGSGFRFYDSFCDWTYSHSYGGARLCVDTQEKAKYFGTQFIDIWNKFLNPNK